MDMQVHKVQIRLHSAIDLIETIDLNAEQSASAKIDALRILRECVQELEPVKIFLRQGAGKHRMP